MSAEAHIRLASLDDVDELARLRWQLYAGDDPDIEDTFEGYRDRFLSFSHEAFADDRWTVWVAEDGSRTVACLWRFRTPRIPQPGRGEPADLAYITSVYVEPALRNTGLGSRLLSTAVEASRAEGLSLAMVWPSARSIPFYERGGFTRLPDPLILDLGGSWHAGGPSEAGGDELA